MNTHGPFVQRFFALQAAGVDGPFTTNLRAVFRARPAVSSEFAEMELAVYVENVCVWRKIRVVLVSQVAEAKEEMMYAILSEAVLFGFYTKMRQAVQTISDYPEAKAEDNFLCPNYLPYNGRAEGELFVNG